jgi:hypothetical protein
VDRNIFSPGRRPILFLTVGLVLVLVAFLALNDQLRPIWPLLVFALPLLALIGAVFLIARVALQHR